jgi:hypothetical protein
MFVHFTWYTYWLIDHVDGSETTSVTAATNGPILYLPGVIWAWKPWCIDDAGWRKHLTCPPELSGNPTRRVIWEQVGGMDERSENFTLQAFCSHLQVIFTCCKILQHGASGFTSQPKEGVLPVFIALKKYCLARFEHATHGVQWQAHSPLHQWGDW